MGRLLLCAAFAFFVVASRAGAEEPTAKCALRIILAEHEGAYIDPQIKMLRPFLEREPFDDWKHFRLFKTKEATLAPKGSDTEVLPNGRTATFTYLEHLLSPEGKHRVRMQLEVQNGDRRELKSSFVLDEGKPFLYALQKKPTASTEMVIVGISCEIPH